jgi:hypothetical protein
MSTELTDRFHEALCNPHVAFELDRNWLGGQALVRITVPGKTPRSKRVQPVPVIVGEDGQTHSDLLRRLAPALEQATS